MGISLKVSLTEPDEALAKEVYRITEEAQAELNRVGLQRREEPLKEYRLNSSYSNQNRKGHNDLTARHGYYLRANSPEEALAQMCSSFPDDMDGFTC